MSDNFFRKKLFFLGFLIPAVFCAQAVLAGNPTTFISPTNNVIDPGSTSTPWGGCGPSDSNCYIQSKTVAVTKLAETKNLDTIQKIVSSNSNTATSPTVTSQALLSALRSLFAGPLPNDILLKLRGPAGPVGPKGDSSVQSSSSGYTPIPSSFAIVGTIQPNPATNFAGATLFSVTDLSSSNFTTTTANTTTLNVTGDSNLTGNLNVAGNITVNTVNGGSVLTSLSGAVMTDQTTPQTIGTSANRLTKLWVTDLDVANTITGNLNGNATTANAATTVTTNANLTGPITSVGNATSVASQTGTGNTFVMNTSPTLITPTIASLIGNKIYPASDSTTAIQINKADGTTNVFNVDTTNGRVGIGTIPQSALDVNGDIRIHAGSGGQIVFADGSTMSSAGLGSAAALSNSTDAIITGDSDSNGSGEVILKTGSNDRLHILNGGNIGIGTPTPATTLDINGITTFRGNIIAGTDNTYDIGASGATRPRTGYFGTSVVAPSFVGNLIGSKIYPASDSTTAIQINKADGTTNVFNVDTTNGRVGIGTTTPTQLLSLTSTTGTAAENFTSEVTTAGNTGATYVTSGTDNAGTGTVAWTTPGNITASDGNYATATPSSGNPTHYLQGTGLGFSVPSNATITGVMLEINDFTSGKGVPIITDNVVSLVKNGTVSGNNEASGSIWNTGPATAVYGSSSDMWGLTLTPADVNASNFGAVISTQNSSGVSRTVSVDFMRITVYYTIPSETWIAGNNSVNANFQISQNSSFGTNDYLSINPAGNVGIGTTTPRTTLEVRSKSGNASNTFFTTNDFVPSSTGSKLLVGFGAASGNTYSELGATSNGGNSWNNLILQSGGGNVGIGTTTPNSTLDVSGNVNIHGSSISQLTMYDQDSLDTFDAIDTGLGDHALNLDGFGGWGKVMVGSFNRSAVSNLVVNGEVGIGTATPSFPMQILSTTNPQLAISYDDSNNSTLGVDASGILTINPTGGVVNIGNPNGTSDNELRIYGYSSSDNYLSLTHTGTDALIDASFGTNWIRIGNEATDLTGGVLLFGNSSSGENREFRVYGYNTNTATANYGSLNYSDTYGGLVIKTDVGQVQIGTGAATTLPSPTSNDLFVSGRLQIAGNTSVGLTGGFSDAPVALSNPATLPPATTTGTAFSPDGTYLAVTTNASPFILIYKRSGDTFTKLADPATLPTGSGSNNGFGTTFSPDGTYLAVASNSSPYIIIYKRSGDTFTKLPDPANLPTGTDFGTTFSPDGTYLAVTSNSSPYITIYKRSGDTFTKLADPATLPGSNSSSTAFSPDGTYLAVTSNSSPYITIYKRSGDTFTKLPDPANLPPATSTGTAFSPDGTYLAVTSNLSPYLIIYKRSGDTFTKLADPATLPDHIKGGTAFSPDGTYLAVTSSNSPYILMYKRSGDTFTKIADPVTLPSSPKGTAFSPDGTYLAVTSNSSPFIIIYKGSGGAIHQEELALNSTASGGLGISKELSLYRSAPGILTLADGGSFNIPTGNLTVGSNLGIGTTSPAANLDVESTAVAGNITNISAPSAVTALGSITGLNVNLSTNYTATGQNVTGGTITLPAVTNTGTAIYAYQGLGITGNALVQNTGAGTDTWNGLAVTMPNITQTTGTVTSTGINITGGTVTSGKSYALISDANSGNVGIATATPGQRLTVGYDGNSALEYSQLSTGNMALSQLEGGAYFGRVGLKENQWGLNNYATTWTQLDSNARAYDGIAMSSDGKIETAVVLSGASKGIYNSTNYGVTWTQVDSSSFYESIAMSSDGKIETAGTSGLNGGVGIYNSTNYGVTWTQVNSTLTTQFAGIAMSSDGKIETAVTNNGVIGIGIYNSTNYGVTWTQVDSNNRVYSGVAMSSDGKIETAVVAGGGIYNSTNYGVTWTQVDSNSRAYSGVAMSSDGKIETATTSGGSGIYNSTNYGVTWTQVDSNSRAYSGIAMSSDGKIETTVVSSGEIYGSEASSTTLGNIGIGTTSPTHLLDVAGNSDITGYLRVGSTSNPVNTTAGDLTARRLSINNGTLGVGTQAELAVFGDNMSDTSGTIGLVNMTGTLNPASDSSASSRTLTMSMQYNTASNFSGTSSSGQNAGWFETRVINAGNIAQTTGGYFAGLIAGSTATTLGTVTDVDAGMFQAVSSFSNALTSTITRARGVHVINSGNFGTGPLTITSQIGIGVDALSGAANNTHLLLGQATAPTGNYGIYDASSSNNYFNGNVGIGTTTPAGMLDVSKALSETPSATVGAYISLSASTLTDNATVGSGTATGAVFNSIAAPTLAATNSSVTTTNAYNLYLGGAPKSSSNETLTNTTALYIAAAAVKPSGAVTNSYGLQVNAQTGATNNYSAIFSGGNVGIGTTSPIYPLQVNGNLGLTSSRNFIIDLAPPGTPSVTPSTSGGSMADGSYFYVVTAVDFNAGTTVQSTQSSVATISGGGGAGSVALSWTGVTGAKSYNVYRTTTSGTYGATSLIANVTPTLSTPGTITYTDVAASTSSGTPPSSTTANAIRLSSTGGTSWLTGAFDLIGNSGTNRDIVTQSNGLNRWIIRTTGTAESGSDVGSDLQFIARHDDGSSSFNVLTFKRSNGFIAINNSTTGTQILNINNGNLQFTYAGPPGGPTVALAGLGAGNLTNGIYSYRVTYVNAGGGESSRGSASSNVTVTDATTNGQIALTNIPTSGDAQIVKRNIYRTISGGANWLLLTTINDNTTTTYTDNIADSSLGATAAPTISTIAGGIYAGSTDAIQISATGTVGILTSPTTAALSVNGQSDLLHGNVRVGDNGSGTNFGLVLTAKDASAQGWMADITGLTQLGAGSTVGTTPYISIINTAGSTQGNVGIGTTVPGDRLEVANTSTLASESLTNGNLTSGTSWTQTGDMALTSNAATYTNSSGTGTLNQASGTLAIAGNPNRLYSFTYTISGISGTAPVATITTSFAATAQTLTTNATGTFTLIFRSAASPGNFVISVTSGAAGAFTIDTLSLKEVTGGNAIVDGLITGGGTAGIKIDGSGNVTIGANQNLTMSSGTGLFSQTYNGTTGNVGSISLSAASQTTDTGLNITQSGATITSYTGNIATIVGAFSGASSTGNLLNLTTVADAAGSALNITANSLTTGKTLSIASSATGLTTAGTNVGSLIDVTESGIMTGFTGSLVNINASGATNAVGDTGTALNINLAGTAQIMKAIVITDATVAGTTDMITMKYSGLVNTSVTSTNKFLRFIDSGNSTLGQISGNSSSSVGVLYTASSDQRIKHDITNTHFSLDDLMKLQVRDYVFNGDPTNTIQTGFIAQELDTIYPEAVATNGDNGIVPLAPDAIPWGVDYGKITPLIVKAIQDLDLKLTDLSNNPIINPSTTIGQYASMFFGDVIEKIDSGVAYMKALVIDTLKVGSPTKPTGITLYDQVTGAPYCLSIENGVTKTAPGECVAVEISNTSNASGNANLDSGGSSSTGSTNSTQTNSDTIPPVITLNGESTLNLNVGDTYTEQGAIATDNVDTSVAIIISGAVDTSTAGTYTITYTAKDTAGNSAIPVIRTVNVGNVSTAPNTTTPTSAATSDTTTDTSSTTDTTTPATP